MIEICCHSTALKSDAKTNQASHQCFRVHKVTSFRLVTSNSSHFHATARSLHLLASKVLFEEGKYISNIMQFKYKYSSYYFFM